MDKLEELFTSGSTNCLADGVLALKTNSDKLSNLSQPHLLDAEALPKGYNSMWDYWGLFNNFPMDQYSPQMVLLHHFFVLIIFIHIWILATLLILGNQIRTIIVLNKDNYYLSGKLGQYIVKLASYGRLGPWLVSLLCVIMLYDLIEYRETFVRTFGIIFSQVIK